MENSKVDYPTQKPWELALTFTLVWVYFPFVWKNWLFCLLQRTSFKALQNSTWVQTQRPSFQVMFPTHKFLHYCKKMKNNMQIFDSTLPATFVARNPHKDNFLTIKSFNFCFSLCQMWRSGNSRRKFQANGKPALTSTAEKTQPVASAENMKCGRKTAGKRSTGGKRARTWNQRQARENS